MGYSNRFASRLFGFLIVVAIVSRWACGNPPDPEHEGQQVAVDSLAQQPIVERDSAEVAEAPILTAEPDAPIVETPAIQVSGNESIGFCDVRDADNRCIAFTGEAWTDDGAQTECSNAPGGSYENGECPTGARIGTCTIHPGGDASLEMVQSFYEPMNPILAEGICPGVFETE